ncbi:MAG: type II toxin-antitoxin system RelE/ParE family toxin [Chitinophagaceae bacterium]|nr:type II toxin-antitoxin system RelE/ParE family toxin [Chitinophagaceae bacterium]
MEFTLIIHELAAEDMIEIACWYDLQSPGLGNRFQSHLEECLDGIFKNPTAHTNVTASTRKAFLKNFPYLVFFEIKGNIIHVYGVIHSKRNPSLMKERFRNIRSSI